VPENEKKSRSNVIESGHTLILGRNDKLMGVIRQLCLANESDGGGVIVVAMRGTDRNAR